MKEIGAKTGKYCRGLLYHQKPRLNLFKGCFEEALLPNFGREKRSWGVKK
jgi:hypothetical protein